ncbi:N utilization substance protein B, partial [Treponema pallidum]
MSEVFPKIGRRRARILAFQALFAWDAAGITPETLTQFTWLRRN